MTTGTVPSAVQELERRGKLTPREVGAAKLFAVDLSGSGWKSRYHVVVTAIGRHTLMLDAVFLGRMSLGEMSRCLDVGEQRIEDCVVSALLALADHYGARVIRDVAYRHGAQ